ncbi:hypothetical protein RIVM261_062390 [Rivularia sp. IAM M-261]|nr:hypothetical protein RIVM261_062390 [Rivularia sp. IAM M-261]
MDAKTVYQTLTNFDSFKSLITTLISMAIAATLTYKIVLFTLKKEVRLFKNLKTKIQVFDPPNKYNKNMQIECDEIDNNPLFNKTIRFSDADPRHRNSIGTKSLIILGYGDDFTFFETIFNKATDYEIPVIIYTYGDSRALEQKHFDLLNKYRWYSVCNTPIRLISDVFTILSTFTFK